MSTRPLAFLQIEPTTRCNFGCGFCAGRHMTQQHMPLHVFEKVLASFHGLRHVELQGEGEPLVHPRFFDMVALIRQRHPQARISTITNGSQFTARNIQQLIQLPLDKVSVSLESPNPQAFREIRKAELGPVLNGIRHLLETRVDLGARRPAIGFAITVLRRTIHDLPAIIDLYEQLKLDGGITIQPLQPMPAYTQFYDQQMASQLLTPSDVAHFNALAQNSDQLASIIRRTADVPSFYRELFDGWMPASRSCPWLANGLYVAADGSAVGCCYIKDTTRDRFGTVNDTSTLWANRQAMQRELADGSIPRACRGCGIAESIARTV